ncbi:MAG: transposase [Eubacterium sp.]|nr:transposase [Eubacterium sp.]
MRINSILQKETDKGTEIFRVLAVDDRKTFAIDCIRVVMPKWYDLEYFQDFKECGEDTLSGLSGYAIVDKESLDAKSKKTMYERFTVIAGVLPFVKDKKRRNGLISELAEANHICKQTIRNHLCLYLAYQDISVLAPKQSEERELSQDEKVFRWAVNKFYYTQHKNSLKTAYTMMLKEKYCDDMGKLLPEHPSFNQFSYFFRKHKNMQTFFISRNGIKDYQMNHRPLLGDGVQQYASHVGVGMFDATVCDIYLIDDTGNLVGRPILTACVDAYSSLCMGYCLSWEGGVYSLRGLLLNMIADKEEHCKKHGILIDKSDWNCCQLPAEFVTDRGSEYISGTFEQVIAEFGVTITNLSAFRAECKSYIERFFGLVQGYFKPYLKGKGILMDDWQKRGSHDYRKDACLTMADFEKIIIHCILYYNSKRVIENYPYTDAMLSAEIKPYAKNIWEWGKVQAGANLIDMDEKKLVLALLPRIEGRFSRYGLKVNRMRYHCEGYAEQYLKGGVGIVAYNPDDVSKVWLIESGKYVGFDLIESRYKGKTLAAVQDMQDSQKEIVKNVAEENLQARIELAEHIQAISVKTDRQTDVNLKNIRSTRKREQDKAHIDYVKEGNIHE